MAAIPVGSDYAIDYQPPEVKKSGWRVYKKSWQTHRGGRPIKTPPSRRRPRWRLIDIFETEEEAREFIYAQQKGVNVADH